MCLAQLFTEITIGNGISAYLHSGKVILLNLSDVVKGSGSEVYNNNGFPFASFSNTVEPSLCPSQITVMFKRRPVIWSWTSELVLSVMGEEEIGKVKSVFKPSGPSALARNFGFCSMKRLGIFSTLHFCLLGIFSTITH